MQMLSVILFFTIFLLCLPAFLFARQSPSSDVTFNGPVVVNTWALTIATETAFQVLTNPGSETHVDALEKGMHMCEEEQRCGCCVGAGGSPDENGETALDASFIDGDNMNAAAVGNLRRVSNAIGVARAIAKYTKHTLLVGDLATDFALEMGFPETDLHSNSSREDFQRWRANNCQPNYRKNVIPDPSTSCGPYKPAPIKFRNSDKTRYTDENSHDTIGMITLSATGSLAAGASTNGAGWKVPGRLGDVSIIGAGAYADSRFGACAASGDGDIMMRFLPCFYTVENLRNGIPLPEASDRALRRIAEFFPSFMALLVVLKPNGEFSGSAYGWTGVMAVMNPQLGKPTFYDVHPITPERGSYIVKREEN